MRSTWANENSAPAVCAVPGSCIRCCSTPEGVERARHGSAVIWLAPGQPSRMSSDIGMLDCRPERLLSPIHHYVDAFGPRDVAREQHHSNLPCVATWLLQRLAGKEPSAIRPEGRTVANPRPQRTVTAIHETSRRTSPPVGEPTEAVSARARPLVHVPNAREHPPPGRTTDNRTVDQTALPDLTARPESHTVRCPDVATVASVATRRSPRLARPRPESRCLP